jgi:hypothetical protein
MDNDLKKFFDEWKEADNKKLDLPEFPKKRSTSHGWWWYAAAAVIAGAAVFQVIQVSQNKNVQVAQDSVRLKPNVITSESSDIYEWESPTESLASDF